MDSNPSRPPVVPGAASVAGPRFLPALVFLLLITGVGTLALRMMEQERRRIDIQCRVTAEQIRQRFEAWMDSRAAAVSHLAKDRSRRHDLSDDWFRADAEELIRRYPGFQALNWVDADGVIRQIVPVEGNEPALGRNLYDHPDADVAEALRLAAQTGQVSRTRLVNLLQGGTGIAAYAPVFDDEGALAGFVNAVFRVDALVDRCLAESRLRQDFAYAFEGTGGRLAYLHGDMNYPPAARYQQEVVVQVMDRPWRLQLRPSAALLARSRDVTDLILLAAGILVSFAIAGLIRVILVRQRELGRSEERFRSMVEASPIPLAITSGGDGAILYANERMSALFGYTHADFLKLRTTDLYPGVEDRNRVIEHVASAGSAENFETPILRRDGTQSWVSSSVQPMTFRGEPAFCVGAVDISERRHMVDVLRSSEELFRAITENSSDITVILSSKGRYKYVSPSIRTMLGYEPADFLGRRPSEIGYVHPDDLEAATAAAREAWTSPKQPVAAPVLRARRPDGTWAYLENLYTALPGVPGVDGLVVHCREITERVLAEEQIRASRQMLQLVLDSIPVRVFWKNRDLVYQGCNLAFAKDAGLASPAGIIGLREGELVWKNQAESYEADEREVMRSGSPKMHYEESQSDLEGRLRWRRSSKVPLHDLEGKVVGVMGCYEDITEARAAEQALQQSEENYRALVEDASELIYVVHESGHVLLANPPAAALLGHTPETIVGRTLEEVLAPDRAEERRRLFARVIEKGKVYTAESHEVYRGADRYYISSVKPMKNKEGRYDRVLAIATDITDRRESERALRESEARYRLLADNVTDVIWTIDLDLRITYISPSIMNLLGYSVEELSGRSFKELMNAENFESIRRIVARDVPKGAASAPGPSTFRTVEGKLTHKDGRKLWTESTTAVVRDENGRALGIQGSTRDISKRKQIEEEKVGLEHQLLQAQKMEAVGTLAGGIAHDFNNLLTGVLGYANLLKLGSEPGDSVYEAADVIEKAADRAAQLTRQLLGFARKGKLQDTPIDIHKSVQEVITLLARTLNKNIEIAQRLRARSSLIKGDPTQIQQVILNLAVNARDAMPNGGQLVFHTEIVEFDDESTWRLAGLKAARYIVLEVTDTGEGIPLEIQDRVFEPFFTTKEQGKGTGMGLATAYGIVKNHGGMIRLESTEGRGATFKVFLPLIEEGPEAATAPETGSGLVRGQGTVMVIDDEAVVRNLATTMLEQLGFAVEAFADPQEAVEYFAVHHDRIALVVIDMIMPRMNGRQCFEALLGIDPNVPAILSSGYGRDNAIQETLDLGRTAFVQKPYRLQTLSDAIRSVLTRSADPGRG